MTKQMGRDVRPESSHEGREENREGAFFKLVIGRTMFPAFNASVSRLTPCSILSKKATDHGNVP